MPLLLATNSSQLTPFPENCPQLEGPPGLGSFTLEVANRQNLMGRGWKGWPLVSRRAALWFMLLTSVDQA